VNRDDTAHRLTMRDIAKKHAAQDAKRRFEAFRARALEQALLAACMCCYPIDALHADWCPAEKMRVVAMEVER
jgi:hypothetical protein